MLLYTPNNLHYPIKITKLLCKPGDDVARNQTLFNYEYTSKVHESSAENPEGYEVERTWPARFESELEGTLNDLTVTPGQILVRRTPVADIEEACKHEVQFGGICAICGTDVTSLSSYNSTIRDTDRATVNTVHGHTALLVSHSEASKADEEAKRRLLDTRKLSLVVDLDQTIIHATVDPTVAEWQQDPSNPNHAAVKDVRAFNLTDDGPGARGCWYYIKLRPGLAEFLNTISKTYELHIYTMGTRAYAENIAKIIDPDRKIFADRILSRDESGSLTAKTLQRLFPVDTRMVVIIDDRGDVWQWSPNLIKVSAYDFFVGIGDINSSFLPKRAELEAKPAKPTNGTNGDSSNNDVSAVDQMMSMAGNQDAESMKEKTDEQDSALASQLADRPLLQKQKILDAADDEAKASPAAHAAVELLSEEQTDSFDHPKYRHNLLQDDDTELEYLTNTLQQIHKNFFEEYDGLPGAQNKKSRDTHILPDAANIMRSLKVRVLSGVHVVFSGIVPLGVDIYAHDMVIWAHNFGAHVTDSITKRTTHVVASPERRTAKVRQAARKPARISIVSVGWLMACFSQWQHVSEAPYRIFSDADRRDDSGAGLPDSFGDTDKVTLSSSEDGDLFTEDETEGTGTPLHVTTNAPNELDDELARYGPKMQREDSSPTNTEHVEDWDDIDAELAEFLGSEAEDDSDRESTRNDDESSNAPTPGKRKRRDTESDVDDEGSRLQKRKKEALARTSSLISVTAAPNSNEVVQQASDPGGSQPEMDENDDLEAALAAELLGDD